MISMSMAEYIIVFFIGFGVGFIGALHYVTRKIYNCIITGKVDKVDGTVEYPRYIVEEVNDTVLVYDQSHNFICQGSDMPTVAATLDKKNNINKAMLETDKLEYYVKDGSIVVVLNKDRS